MKSLRAYDGRVCQVDTANPLVMIKGRDYGAKYQRGCLVYPISDREGQKPGHRTSNGWVTVSALDTDVANFLGVEVGKTAIPLKDLIKISAKPLGISQEDSGFKINGKEVSGEFAIYEMLEYSAMMQLPEGLRDSSKLSK